MKAIDLLLKMDCDADLAEFGTICEFKTEKAIQAWFGQDAKLTAGNIQIPAIYYALYDDVEQTYGFIKNNEADAIINTMENNIFLWRIE